MRDIGELSRVHVFRQLDEIVRDTTPPAYGEEHLAALTAGERTTWAEARETYFAAGLNRSSLEAIEKAAFVLILDDEEYNIGTVSLSRRRKRNLPKNRSIQSIQLDDNSSSSSFINNKVINLYIGVVLTHSHLILVFMSNY